MDFDGWLESRAAISTKQSKMIILTTFEAIRISEAAQPISKIGSGLNQTTIKNLNLPNL